MHSYMYIEFIIGFVLELVNLWTYEELSKIHSKSEEISRWRPIDKTLHYDGINIQIFATKLIIIIINNNFLKES